MRLKPLSHRQNMQVESGFDLDNTFHMHESTLDTEADQTSLLTQRRIRIKKAEGVMHCDDVAWPLLEIWQVYLVLAQESFNFSCIDNAAQT